MGHRFSKTAINANSSLIVESYKNQNNTTAHSLNHTSIVSTTSTNQYISNLPSERRSNSCTSSSNIIPIPINLQIQENPAVATAATCTASDVGIGSATIVASSSNQLSDSDSSSLTSLNASSLQNRQIIIKIQLAKMENGNESQTSNATSTEYIDGNSLDSTATSTAAGNPQFVNLTLNGNFIYGGGAGDERISETTIMPTTSSNSGNKNIRANATAGGCSRLNISNNYNNNRQIQNEWDQIQSTTVDILSEYVEVLDDRTNHTTSNRISTQNNMKHSRLNAENSIDLNNTETIGCLNSKRKSKSALSNASSSSATSPNTIVPRRRYRDAFKRFLEPSSFKSSIKSREQNKKHSEESIRNQTVLPTALPITTSPNHLITTPQRTLPNVHLQQIRTSPQQQTNTAQTSIISTTPSSLNCLTSTNSSNNSMPISIANVGCNQNSQTIATNTNQVTTTTATIWRQNGNDLIIPITSPPQFVVVQCTPSSVVTLGRLEDNAIRLTSAEINSNGTNNHSNSCIKQASKLPVAHSQIDFVHCLVPDLEKIINSSFYWGKIDRYEAERLLEGKPEGTFLLRDSAQEEYLFSVTFRKYGRSLHARIEQSGHKFSFDFHDPQVHTASTVTGLLQHYKNPTFVMFFEPMLTIPLHRKTTFSLQELARAVIVSNTTYDGVNELELPMPLKKFIKEYHYKQKLRVKLIDESLYSCT